MTETCTMNYCQDGIWVYFPTEVQWYNEEANNGNNIYGYYELQPNYVNDRPYFKMGVFGLWWNGFYQWWIGRDIDKGKSLGWAYVNKDVFCPHQLSDLEWRLYNSKKNEWYTYNGFGFRDLFITCKCIFIQTEY